MIFIKRVIIGKKIKVGLILIFNNVMKMVVGSVILRMIVLMLFNCFLLVIFCFNRNLSKISRRNVNVL